MIILNKCFTTYVIPTKIPKLTIDELVIHAAGGPRLDSTSRTVRSPLNVRSDSYILVVVQATPLPIGEDVGMRVGACLVEWSRIVGSQIRGGERLTAVNAAKREKVELDHVVLSIDLILHVSPRPEKGV